MLARQTDLSFASAAGTLIVERTTDLIGLLAVMFVALRLLPWDRVPVRQVALVAVIGMVGMYAAAAILRRLHPEAGGGIKQKVLSFAAKLGSGLTAVRSPRRLAALVGISVAIWCSDALALMVTARATGLKLSYTESAGVLVGLAVGVAIPGAPGYIGTYEFFGKEALRMLGHDAATALTFVVFLHFLQFSLMALTGLPCLYFVTRRKRQ
jgi:uncharacterized membrane protein YbhN (UPF0104 family)